MRDNVEFDLEFVHSTFTPGVDLLLARSVSPAGGNGVSEGKLSTNERRKGRMQGTNGEEYVGGLRLGVQSEHTNQRLEAARTR